MSVGGSAHLRWAGPEPGFVPVAAGASSALLVADSWLVEDGRVKALPAHLARFSGACALVPSMSAEDVAAFVREALPQLPTAGRWFPRLELVEADGGRRLQLLIRPAPPRGDIVRLWVPPDPDRRTRPAVKGPDLPYLTALRAEANAVGADEAVLLSPDGRVREGATTSILWWRDDTLCAPADGPDILPGVTRAQLLRLAAELHVPVAFESPRPRDLDGLEVWAVNALHGIRPVTAWLGTGAGATAVTDLTAAPARRAPEWQARLEHLGAPVASPA
ncbi:aminotransferase class IV [Streptomyces sp. CA-249302]|uniref:aminotransferase class IV n=1 Tax=Streptomyces sp. CA-249302 TaxID=3240058 RepID=UPI003D8D33D1